MAGEKKEIDFIIVLIDSKIYTDEKEQIQAQKERKREFFNLRNTEFSAQFHIFEVLLNNFRQNT